MHIPNLEQYLRSKFGQVRRSRGKHGLELIVNCPVCGKRKLSINASTGFYQCWRGCMSGHVQKLLGDVRIAQQQQAPRSIPTLPTNVNAPGDLLPIEALDPDNPLMLYLEDREFDAKLISKHYGVRYCTTGQTFMGGVFDTSNTMIMPVWINEKLVGWQSRLLYDPDKVPDDNCEAMGYIQDPDGDWIRPPKYFTSPGLDKGRILYNYDWARQSDVVVVCEGVTDVWSVGRCAVATFGKNITEYQTRFLKAYWKIVILLFDPGDAEPEMQALISNLGRQVDGLVKISLDGYKDAGAAPQNEIWRQIGHAAHAAGVDLLNYRMVI